MKISKLLIFFLVFFASIVLVNFGVSRFFEKYLVYQLQSTCEKCELRFANASISIFGSGIHFQEVVYEAGDPSISRVQLRVEDLRSGFNLFKYVFHNELDFGEVKFLNPSVILIDGDSHSSKIIVSKSKINKKIVIQKLSVAGGTFQYIRHRKGQLSSLEFTNIEASTESVGNFGSYRKKPMLASAKAQLGNTGSIDLKVSASPFAEILKVAVDVDVKDQDISALSSFLIDNDGINIRGLLSEGKGNVQLLGNNAEAKVYANYKDFNLSFIETNERSEFSSLLMNVGKSVILDSENLEENKLDKMKSISIKREAQESVVSFILRGLKEAALSVASSPQVNRKFNR